uniref:C2H2-type domain-containing protein n=1 Tax=Anopheles dirus TaxID=7168 RepID=A0A182NP05_9DIPT
MNLFSVPMIGSASGATGALFLMPYDIVSCEPGMAKCIIGTALSSAGSRPIQFSKSSVKSVMMESLVSTKNVAPSVIQCEARTQSEEEITDCVASMETTPCALLGNINLPHKKRLAKKLGDTKEGVCNGNAEIDQSLLVGNMQPSQRVSSAAVTEDESIQRTNPSDQDQSSAHQNRNGNVKSDAGKANDAQQTSLPQSLPTFSCQLCGKQVQDQLLFFNHLKEHYEPSVARSTGSADSVNSSAMVVKNVATSPAETMPAHEKLTSSADSKKAKPKLPRVKHTKKLKNDRALKQTIVEPENLATLQKIESKPTPMATSSSTASKGTVGVLLQKAELSDAMVAIECSLNGGEFSETEDMLEGIRNVVQKVQETVDTDTTEELCIADNRTWFPAANDDKVISDSITSTLMPQTEKVSLDLAGDALDTHGIHIQNAGDNFLLLLSKTQFNDADLLQTETSDSSLLKPLDPSTCEQLTHTSSLVEPNRNENYVAGEQNLQQLQPTLHSATFPLLSTVDSTSFRVNESLSMSSILELIPSATEKLPAEISSNSYGPPPCVHVPEQKNTELLKNEQKPNDYDEGGDGEGDANYNSLQFATNIDAPDMNPPLDDIPPGDAHDEQTGEDYSFSGEELDEQTNEEHTESQEHLGEDDKDSSFDGA